MPQQYSGIIMMLVMLVFFYLFLIRPQKKKEKEFEQMRNSLAVGDNIITIGGIVGKVVIVKDDYITIETSGMNTRLEITKWGVSAVIK